MNEQQFKSLLKTIGFKITEVPNIIDAELFLTRSEIKFIDSWFASCPDGFLRHRKTLLEAWGVA